MNLRELRKAVLSRCGVGEQGDSMLTVDVVHGAIANALRQISADRRWSWLLTSFSGATTTGAYTLPNDCAEVERVDVLESGATTYKVAERALEPSQVLAPSDTVCRWTVAERALRFSGTFPVDLSVSATFILWYYQAEPPLTSDTQEPLMPEQYHLTVVLLAAAECMDRKKDWTAAGEFRAQAQGELNRMRDRPSAGNGRGTVRLRAYQKPIDYATWG